MTKLVYLPIDISNFHAYESDVKECSELYDMEGVTQINKIHELIDDRLDRHPIYSVVRNDNYHYLFLDRSEFKLDSLEKVLSCVRIWIETESIEYVIQYNNK